MVQKQQVEQETLKPQAVESAGVQNLIGRLRDQGVAQGRSQAEALVTAAQQQAADIIAAAKREAETLLAKAKEDAGKLKAAGEDSVRLATRDTILSLESDVVDVFRNNLGHLIKGTLEDPAFLQRLILEVAGKASPAAAGEPVQVLLPAEIASLEDLQRRPEETKPGTLMHFVLSQGEGMLRDGVSFGAADDGAAGIRVKLEKGDMRVDLTESSLNELLLRHMVPRFRALLRGAALPDTGPTKPTKAA